MRSLRVAGLVVTVVAAFAAAAVLLPHSPGALRELLTGVGPAAPLIVLAGWVLLTPAMFPGTILAAVGGLAFGALGGSLLAFAGAVVGGLAAFTLARTTAREPVQRLVQRRPRLAGIEAVLEQRGFASVLAARLMPGVPVTGLHYAAGISPVRARAFAGAIAIGALLRTVPYAILGQGFGSGSITTILIAAGMVALGGAAAGVLVRHIRRASAPLA
jgi:uncharacterized membrane protein YdjX (TVP38/TMEM64 family)